LKIEKDDRRSRRTRQLIGSALTQLMTEKRFDDITVQDILDRADIGRSTFYAHYTDKEDLLANEVARVIHNFETYATEWGHAHGGLLPSLELFRHIQQQRQFMYPFLGGSRAETTTRSLQTSVSKIVEQKLQTMIPDTVTPSIPLPVVAHFVVSTFLMLLNWWFENDLRQSPEQMNEIFQKLVMPSLHGLINAPER
jgi:AcrR family transcriptional regulator